jgi:hypothetical protein
MWSWGFLRAILRLKENHMKRFWVVQATRTSMTGGWQCTEQIPTFLLDSNIQGFTDAKGAVEVAKRMIGPGANVDENSVAPWEDGDRNELTVRTGNWERDKPYILCDGNKVVDTAHSLNQIRAIARAYTPKAAGEVVIAQVLEAHASMDVCEKNRPTGCAMLTPD